ncbi:Organic cation/carnitine transporter 4 [Acropora cervicornis]|uniref:Organic cation/carnitine transporter 4 n=1 Tax=Acropora cervicornis TaxID=6130 RepID=A0AAD9VFF2_ACRCE|nr:Organic cation/carnitine transporter 4 [Acropora cervicornis]
MLGMCIFCGGQFQRILFFGLNTILVFTVTCQFSLLVFAFGNPGFHCVTPNVTCDAKKCCDDCKAYEFNGPFHSTVSELLSGVVSSFVHNIPLFAFLRFLSGFGLSGVLLSHYIYSMELVGPSIRTAAGNISYFLYNGYQILLVLIAYYVRSWRSLLLITMATAVRVYPFWK